MIGQTFSHFRILEKLGEGGMGVVYKAEDTTLKRVVALKFLPQHVSSSATDKARFLLEAQAAAALNHPNICTIHGIEEQDGQTFIVMEFVDGQTLREKRGTLSLPKAVDIGVQIAEGLSVAHEKGIVHRDIKPENIMVRKDGLAQIMDFGLAKLRASRASRLTKEGSTIGTAGYMSPEQVQGQETDHRSDIFSLGVLLYELFTGELPFKGVHETALLYEIVNVDPAPMSAVKPEIDPELDRIVLECLQKEPDERYNSVKDLAKDLKRFKRESTRSRASRVTAVRPALKAEGTARAAVAASPTRSWRAALGYVLAAVVTVAFLGYLFGPWRKDLDVRRPVMRFSVDPSPEARPAPVASGPAISHDGTLMAYVGQIANSKQIYVRRFDEPGFQPIPGTEGATEPTFSPDGRWIVFSTNLELLKVPIAGGAPLALCPISGSTRGIVWAADDFIYFGQVSRGIARVPASGGARSEVTALDTAAGESSHRYPQLLADGKTLLYTVKLNSLTTFDDAIIVAERMGTRDRAVLVRGGMSGRALSTGHLIYGRAGTLYALRFDADRLTVDGSPVALEKGIAMNKGTGEGSFGLSDQGILVYAPGGGMGLGSFKIGWMDQQGVVTAAFDTVRMYIRAALSPDGKRVAASLNGANNDLWMIQLDRGVLTRFTFAGGNNDQPTWSADGRFLFYSAEQGRSPNLFRRAWDGSGSEERLASSENPQLPTSVSPDGRNLAYDEKGDIWILPIDSATGLASGPPHPFIQTPAGEWGGLFSPNGRYLAYRSDESATAEVYVTAFPTRERKWQVSSGGGSSIFWSRDGKRIFYRNNRTLMVADVSTAGAFDFSLPRKVCEIPANVALYDIAPDRDRLLVMTRQETDSVRVQFGVVSEWYAALKENFIGRGE